MDYPHERAVDSFRSSTARWVFGSFAGLASLLLCAAGVGFLLIGWRWLRNLSASYQVTDQRLIVRRGILLKTVDEIELYRVRDVRLEYSLLKQMVDIGTIALTSTDPSTGGAVFLLRDVPMARDRREGLRGLIERARMRRGVRELHVDPIGAPALGASPSYAG